MRRVRVGFIDDPIRVVDGFGGPIWLDVDCVGIAFGPGTDVVGSVLVPLDPFRHV